MKKLGLFITIFFCNLLIVSANERVKVKLNKCVDGDTAKFELNGEIITARFLAIDTPESVHPTIGVEPYGKEASNYTCEKLTNAKKIEIEYDDASTKTDKYGRHLGWIFVDNYLLQDMLVKEGLAEVTYLYGKYKYTATLQDHEAVAKANKLNMWNEDEKTVTVNNTQKADSNKTEILDDIEDSKFYTFVITAIAIIAVLKKKKII